MIKTKEDLKMTFFRKDDTAVLEKVVGVMGNDNYPEHPKAFYLGVNFIGSFCWMPEKDFGICSRELFLDAGCREITIADFEEEEVSQKQPLQKYRYVKVDISPAEIYRAMLDGETFYLFEKAMFWEDGAFWLDKDGGVRITYIEEDHQVCRREEVKWQDAVSTYLEGDYQHRVENLVNIKPERFLEAARIALRAVGELSY